MNSTRDVVTGRFIPTTTTATSRVCGLCGVEKLLDAFGRDPGRMAGRAYWCKDCRREQRNSAEVKAYHATYYQRHKEEWRKRGREYMRKWRAEHPEETREKGRINMRRRTSNGKRRAYESKRRAAEPGYRIEKVLRSRMHTLLRGQTDKRSTKELLGCSTEGLRAHIEQQWLPGMSWENYGPKGWHIDHIKPVVSFDLLDGEQQRRCFHYTNLRPLWAEENMRRRFRSPE